MELDSFNLKGRVLPIEIINLIFKIVNNFDEILKLRTLNKFNKLLIEQRLHIYYNQLRQINNQLPIIEFKNLKVQYGDLTSL